MSKQKSSFYTAHESQLKSFALVVVTALLAVSVVLSVTPQQQTAKPDNGQSSAVPESVQLAHNTDITENDKSVCGTPVARNNYVKVDSIPRQSAVVVRSYPPAPVVVDNNSETKPLINVTIAVDNALNVRDIQAKVFTDNQVAPAAQVLNGNNVLSNNRMTIGEQSLLGLLN